MVLRFLTAGESHGPALLGILEGLPAGLPLTEGDLLPRMRRRQAGYGRGPRMRRETDRPRILAGTWKGKTTGAPLGLFLENRSNRKGRSQSRLSIPRPGHADLAGMLKYGFDDAHPVIERASARETAMRTALGAAACHLLEQTGIRLTGFVREIGGLAAPALPEAWRAADIERARSRSRVSCPDGPTTRAIIRRIDEATARGETLGGRVELIVWDLPPGLGSYAHSDRRLDARLGAAFLSIPSVKEVEWGEALAVSRGGGREAHDLLRREGKGLTRSTNRAGGLEGGVTNGSPLVVRLTLKPISTQRRTLPSVNLDSGHPVAGRYIRSDTVVVPAVAVIAEAVAGLVLADALLEKFGADRFDDLSRALADYKARMPRWPAR